MLIRVIDYVGNLGGGARFVAEMLHALLKKHAEINFEFVSYGAAAAQYRHLFEDRKIDCRLHEIPPRGAWRNEPRTIFGLRRTQRITRMFGIGTKWHYEVPATAFGTCDVAWFPWVHRHRIPDAYASRVVGSFHDAIFFQFPELLPRNIVENERLTTKAWIASNAHLCVSSQATVTTMTTLFDVDAGRFAVIPLSGDHTTAPQRVPIPAQWEWAKKRFIICPANTFPHKNHEVLLTGVGHWSQSIPLVLTGAGTDLVDRARGLALRRYAQAHGLSVGKTLIPLGYVSDPIYYSLLERAWAVVMPTLAEGGGSFPVWEAVLHGVPVVCSNIPVLREQLDRIGGRVLWFDPHDPHDLSRQLSELKQNYGFYKADAESQVPQLRHRTWDEVAKEYWSIISNSRIPLKEKSK